MADAATHTEAWSDTLQGSVASFLTMPFPLYFSAVTTVGRRHD